MNKFRKWFLRRIQIIEFYWDVQYLIYTKKKAEEYQKYLEVCHRGIYPMMDLMHALRAQILVLNDIIAEKQNAYIDFKKSKGKYIS